MGEGELMGEMPMIVGQVGIRYERGGGGCAGIEYLVWKVRGREEGKRGKLWEKQR